jgi:hypothetical protein
MDSNSSKSPDTWHAVASWYITCKVWNACAIMCTNYQNSASLLQNSLHTAFWKLYEADNFFKITLKAQSRKVDKIPYISRFPGITDVNYLSHTPLTLLLGTSLHI